MRAAAPKRLKRPSRRISGPRRAAPREGAIPSLPPGVQLVTLDNGLTVIVREDHSAPVVSAQAWVMTGSIHEGRWLGAGLSHLLEHMLFKGTTSRPGSRIDQEVQEAGGYMNAYTSFNRTVYHIDVPNTGARVALDILCDVMQHATLPEEELAKEKQVILREMDMNQDDPERRASRRLFEVAYTRSPYRFTVIGYPDIFNTLSPADVRAFYREHYVPNNTFFVVVGDVAAETVLAQIREAYAHTPARPLPPFVLPEEPPQTAPREVLEEAPIELGHVHVAWHIPDLRHPDLPALDVLSVLLGVGRSSRLYQQVREKQALVHQVEAWTYSPGGPGLLGMSAVVDADKFPAAREAMLAEVARLRERPVAAAELRKAVKQFLAATLATRKTMQGQAQDLGGSWLAANDLNFSARYLDAIRRVTPADVQRVARQYLTEENRTLYALLPLGAAPRRVGVVESAKDQAIQKFVLPNGLRLLVKADHRLPFVEYRAALLGGVLAETPQNNGLSQLCAKLLLKGTRRRTAAQLVAEIESLGGSVDTYSANNSFGVTLETLSEDFATGLDVLADVLLQPTFPEVELEREREAQLAAIRAQKDELLRSALRAMRRGLFGPTGYGLDPLGEEESVRQLRRADLQAFHARLVTPQNCVLAIYGDVQPELVKRAVEKTFGRWRAASDAALALPSPPALPQTRRVVETRDKKQAVLALGWPATTLRDEARHPLELLQETCSDLGSRLFLRIREQLGLAYYVGALHVAGPIPGYFAFYAGTAPDKAEQVERELLQEAESLRANGVTPEELRRAKAKILGQKKIARQDLGTLAMMTALDELYGLGYDYLDAEDALIEAVTPEQIRAVAQKFLRPDAFVLAVVRPA
jgi:zinc protease